MDKLKITPAPWHVMRGDVLDKHGRMVAAVDSADTDDAQLIAAAPELLESLQNVLSAWVDEDMADITDAEENSLIKARAAINKALGK